MYRKNILLGFVFLTILTQISFGQETDWTHFRGSNSDGKSSNTNLPIEWNDSTNITWKTAIHGQGWSSPVVLDNQIWLTTATEDGKEMSAICIDFTTGKTIFNVLLCKPDSVYRKHAVNSYATPTSAIESGVVYHHFGRYGTYAMKTSNGEILWQRTDLDCAHAQGPGSSVFIYKNKLILHFEGTDVQYIVALDKTSGETIWKSERPKDIMDKLEPIGKKAYITPLIINVNKQDLLISNGAAICIAYDPETGEEIWRIVKGEDTTMTQPLYENGVLYFITSNISREEGETYIEMIAVNPDGKGDIAATNILWTKEMPILQMLTPVINNGKIYHIDTKSNMMCIDAKTGDTIWTKKVKGKFNASGILADGKVYFSSTRGETVVIKESAELEILATNKLDGAIWATPAVIDKSLLIRTENYLYRIEK